MLSTRAGALTGEDLDDLAAWVRGLDGPVPVDEVVVLACDAHGAARPTWAYVEADAATGVARRRCLSCATTVHVLDSGARWTWPPVWACRGCGHSIVEVAAGLGGGERVAWVVLAARCVECGHLAGLTDLLVDGLPRDEVVAAL